MQKEKADAKYSLRNSIKKILSLRRSRKGHNESELGSLEYRPVLDLLSTWLDLHFWCDVGGPFVQ